MSESRTEKMRLEILASHKAWVAKLDEKLKLRSLSPQVKMILRTERAQAVSSIQHLESLHSQICNDC